MRFKLIRATILLCFASGLLLGNAGASARSAEMQYEATLVWGTDEAQPPPGRNYKPVSPEIQDKLRQLPLKWSHWFEVHHKEFAVTSDSAQRVVISDKCQLDVKRLGSDGRLEVVLIGKGKEVVRRKQTLPQGEMLALGGNAPNHTAWLVILKRLK